MAQYYRAVTATTANRSVAEQSTVPLLPACLAEHTSCVIAKVGQAVARLIDAELEVLGLRARHYQVLKTLAEGHATSQQALGSALRIDGATMVSTLDDLERAALVERRRNRSDRRSCAVRLTRPGRAALAQADASIERVNAAVLGDVSADEHRQLRESLGRLVNGGGLSRAVDEVRGRRR